LSDWTRGPSITFAKKSLSFKHHHPLAVVSYRELDQQLPMAFRQLGFQVEYLPSGERRGPAILAITAVHHPAVVSNCGVGMPTLPEIVDWDVVTARSQFRYQFTLKHHGADSSAAQWLPSMSQAEEFAIFDAADGLEISDDNGNLYGLQPDVDGDLRHIGTWNEQLAEFPAAREGEPWHGYPVYPLQNGPAHRRGQKCRPDKMVFDKMVTARLITPRQRKRLMKGDFA
jgi:hypothetical protein